MGFHLIRLVINGNDTFSLEDAENYIRRHSAGWNLSSSFQPDQSDFKGFVLKENVPVSFF